MWVEKEAVEKSWNRAKYTHFVNADETDDTFEILFP